MPTNPTWDDIAEDPKPTWNDIAPDDQATRFKRDELAKQMFEARLEGERGKLYGGLADIGSNAAYWTADALAKVDPTGVSGNILANEGIQRTPPFVSPEQVGNATDSVKGILNYPSNVPIFPTEGKLGEISRGLGKAGEEMASSFTDPGVLSGLGLSRYLPHEAARLFQLQSLGGVIPSAQQALQAQNLEEATKGLATTVASSAIPIALGKSASESGKFIPTELPKTNPEEYAKYLAEQLRNSEPVVPATYPTPERQLGIRVPEGPFTQPGIPELADAALAERMRMVQVPGQEGAALGELQRAVEPPQITPERSNLAERIQGGGEAPYGKISFMREAESPLPERTQEALASEATKPEPSKGIITGRAIEDWADEILKGGATHAGPDVLAAYMVKGVALIERGIINFAEWSKRMLEEHGPSIQPHLESIYNAAKATIQRVPIEETGNLKSAREIVEQRLSAQPKSVSGVTPQGTGVVSIQSNKPLPTSITQAVNPATATITPTGKPAGVKVSLDDIYNIFESAPKQPTSIKQKGINLMESIRAGFSSKFRPINKLAEDIAKSYGLTSSKDIAGIMEQLKGSTGKGEAEIYRFNRDVSSLVKGQEKDFNVYMFLNRSLDRLHQDLKDIQSAQAGHYVKDLNRRSVAQYTIPVLESKLAQLEQNLGPEKVANFQKAAEGYQQYMDQALRLQVESGRMSQDVYNTIKNDNQFYAPFKVMKYLEEGMRPEGSGRKIDTVADYTKAMKGIEDPNFKLGDMLGAARQSILVSRILADKAMAMQHVADLAKIDTNGTFIRKLAKGADVPDGWSLVNVFENGVKERYVTRPEVAEAVQLFPGNTGGIVSRILGLASVPFKLGATALNLPFQVSNLLADVPRQALVSRYGLRGVDDLVRYPLGLIKSIYSSMEGNIFGKDNKLFQDFLDSGAAAATVQSHLTPEALRYRDPSTMSKAKRVALNILYAPAEFSNAIEQVSKILGVERAMRAEGVTSGKELAQKVPEAITEIRRFSGSPDFGRQGRVVEQARLNLLYMFLNARIQGTVADLGRLAGRDGVKQSAITWFRVGTAIGIPTAMLYALNNSPEFKKDYDNRSQKEKDNYWLIPKDSFITNEQGEVMRDFWRIPKRESSKWIANAVESGLQFAQQKDAKSFGNFAQNMIEDISPVNIQGNTAQERMESVVSSLNPIIKGPLEAATGRDTYRHKPLIKNEKMLKASPEEQYTDRTPEAFKKLANLMPDVMPEFLRSPILLENMTRSMTAGLLTQFMSGKPVKGRSDIENMGLLQRFQSTPYTDNPEFTKQMQQLDRESADEYLKRNRDAQKIMDDNEGKPIFDLVQKAGKDPKLMQHVVDLWVSKQNGATSQDRQLIALPAKQRAEYIYKLLKPMTPDQKQAAILDMAKKRVLTKSVFEEMSQIKE